MILLRSNELRRAGLPYDLSTIALATVEALRAVWLVKLWLRGLDLNQRPLGYEPNELPGCSTPRYLILNELK